MDPAREAPRRIDGEVRVIAEHLHAQTRRRVCDEHADRAEANHAQALARDFGADELRLPLFNLLCDVFAG